MPTIALSELLGAPVMELGGRVRGRVREIAMCPQEDPIHISGVIVKTKEGDRVLPPKSLQALEKNTLQASSAVGDWQAFHGGEGFLLLTRDLLDQQIIDVHGRKVVRVNDVDLTAERENAHLELKLASVDVGARGALRRLLKGLVPAGALRAMVNKIPPRVIPWEFVDLIETDPARRVKLKIEHERLAKLHPADIADIVEELAPAEREAVFETLDEDVAAEALEEIDPKLQVKILESLDSDRAADIVEAMDPDAAADVLGDLPKETTDEILEEMQPEEREEVSELLEFREDTAAGRMTTEYLAMGVTANVQDAVETLKQFEGGIETLSTIFLLGPDAKLMGAVPLARIVVKPGETPLKDLSLEPLISAHAGANEKAVAELFDKYNLLTLPVVDDDGRMTGVITADDVISLLRSKL